MEEEFDFSDIVETDPKKKTSPEQSEAFDFTDVLEPQNEEEAKYTTYDAIKAISPELNAVEQAGKFVGAVNRGLTQVISAPLKFVGAIEQAVGGVGYATQAGQSVEDFTEYFNPTDPNYNQTANAVGEGLGQGISMFATGGTSAAPQLGAKAPSLLNMITKAATSKPAMLGGTMTAVPEWEQAKEAGLDDQQALEVLLKNYLVGQTEAIPIQNMLGRLNRVTGNQLANTVKTMGVGGIEEFMQEGLQTYLSNQVAKEDYDPDRDPLFQVLESAKVGGIVGMILPGMVSIAQNLPAEKRVKLERKLGEIQANDAINEIGDTGDPQLNAEIDAAAQIDPVDKQVLEEIKVAEAQQEEQKEVEAEEKLQEDLNPAPVAENTETNTAEEAEIKPSQTPEYKEAVAKVQKLQDQFAKLDITENADELLFDLREARQALAKIAGTPKTKKTPIQKQIEDTTGITKPEKSVKMTPNEAIKQQVQTFYKGVDKGVKKGAEAKNELVSKVQEAIKDSPLSPKQVSTILTKLRNTNLYTPGSISKLNTFIDKVSEDAEYVDKLSTANKFRKQIAKKRKSDNRSVKEKNVLKVFNEIKPDVLENIDEYNELATTISEGIKPNATPINIEAVQKKVRSIVEKVYQQELQVSAPKSASVEDLIDQLNEKKYQTLETNRLQSVADELGIDIEEARLLEESDSEMTPQGKADKLRQPYLKLAKEKKIDIDTDGLTTPQLRDVEDIGKIDVDQLTTDQLKQYIRVVDRINENNDFGLSGIVASYGKAQQGWKELNKLDVNTLNLTQLEEVMDSQPMAIEAIMGLPEHAAKFQLYTGIKGMNDGGALSVREAEDFSEIFESLQKSNPDGFKDESLIRQGIYQEIIRQPETMEADEAVAINKQLIEDSIESLKANGYPDRAAIEEKLYAPFKSAKTMDEVQSIMQKIDPSGKKVMDAIINYNQTHKISEGDYKGLTILEAIQSDNERFENKDIEKVNNYGAPRVWKKVGRGQKIDFDDIAEFNPVAKAPKPKQLKAGMNLQMRRREGHILDFNVHKNAVDNIQKSILRAAAKPYQYQVRNFLRNETDLQKLFGRKEGDAESIKRTNNLIDSIFNERQGIFFQFEKDLLANGRPEVSKFVRNFASFLSGLKKTGYAITLSGFTQAPKQATVLTNVARQLGSDAAMVVQSVSELNKDVDAAKNFFRGETIDVRGEQNALLNVGRFFNASDRIEAESKFGKFLSQSLPNLTEKRFRSKWGGAGVLTTTDVSVAKSSYLAFYKQYLKKNGVEYKGLEEENKLRNEQIRKEARAYAKQRVDTLQVVSTPAEQSKFFKEQGILPELARAFFVPYGGFASSSKARLFNDYKALITGNSAQKKAAWKDIQSTAIEQASFIVVSHGLKLMLAGTLGLLLREFFNLDDEEDWDEWWAKTKKQASKDMLFSNLPVILGNPGEDVTVDMINSAYYSFLKQEDPELTQKEYEKEHAPLTRFKNYDQAWWDYLGPYGASIAKMADAYKVVEQGESDKLSEDQKNLAMTTALALVAQNLGMIPADVSNLIRSEFNKQRNAANERGNNTNSPRILPKPRPRRLPRTSARFSTQ